MARTANPALGAKTFLNLPATAEKMTIQGTVNKSLFLITLVIGAALFSWQQVPSSTWGEASPQIPIWYLPAAIGALIVALIIIFKKTTAPFLAPVYALTEGLLLGAISSIFEYRYPGIVQQALLCTFGTFGALLMAYKSELIPVTNNFRLGVTAATGGIALVYLLSFVLGFFGISVPYLHEGGPIGIGVSVVIVVIAALNLVLDFDFIEKGAEQGAPKYMEWYASFGLLVTLIWLYLEILRLLAKARKK